jgi:hypothetical protein
MASCVPSYSRIFSIADIATAIALVSLGSLAFNDLPFGAELQFSRIVLSVYLILAGALLTLCALLDIPPIRKSLPALYSYVGKATTGLLLGTLALGTSKSSIPLSIAVITWSVACFFLSVFMTTPPMPLLSCGGGGGSTTSPTPSLSAPYVSLSSLPSSSSSPSPPFPLIHLKVGAVMVVAAHFHPVFPQEAAVVALCQMQFEMLCEDDDDDASCEHSDAAGPSNHSTRTLYLMTASNQHG